MNFTKREDAVEAFVLSHGMAGVGIRVVCVHFGFCNSTAGAVLRSLKLQGKIEPSHPKGGPANRWGAPGTTSAWAETVRIMGAKRRAERDAASKRKSSLALDELAADAFARESVQRVVPARSAPFVKLETTAAPQ